MKNIKIVVLLVIFSLLLQILCADKVADFKLEDIKGKQVRLSEIQGDGLVILDFWATWCVPCKKGLPKLDEIHNKYDEVNVVTVCTDKPRKKIDAKAYLKSNKFSFYSLFDLQGTVKKNLNITSIPRTLILDPDGEIIYDHTGFQRGDEKHYEEVIEKWLDQQADPDQTLDIDQEEKPDEANIEKGEITIEADKSEIKDSELEQEK